MLYLFTYSLVLGTLLSCGSPQIEQVSHDEIQELSIQFNFYPSSGGSAIYTVALVGDTVQIVKHEPLGNEPVFFSRLLSKQDVEAVGDQVSSLRRSSEIVADVILDSWRIEVLIHGDTYFNKSGVRLRDLPMEYRRLFNLLTKGSTVEVDLFDFS